MTFLIDEENKRFTLFSDVQITLEQIEEWVKKMETLYPDIRTWKGGVKSTENIITVPVSTDLIPQYTSSVPEKPEAPEFEYTTNTLPEKNLKQ